MKYTKLLLSLYIVLYSCAANSADREWIQYNELLRITKIDKFYSAPLSQRDKVKILGVMSPNNPEIPPSTVVFTVVFGEEKKIISVNADGTFDPSINPSWINKNPKVLTSLPLSEKAKFTFAVVPVVSTSLNIDYADMMASVNQANQLINSQAGIMRFLMPKFTGILVRFFPQQIEKIKIVDFRGEKFILSNTAGIAQITLDDDFIRNKARMIFPKAPQSFDFSTD